MTRTIVFLLLILCLPVNNHCYAQDHSLKQITFCDSTHDGYPYWSPDGQKIAFSSTRTGYWAIWVMDPDMDIIRSKLKTN